MSASTTRHRISVRSALPAAAIAVAAGLATPALAQNWHWNVANGSWPTAGNWLPAMPPPANANVFIGSTGAAANGTVTLAGLGGVQAVALNITDGMTLRNEHRPVTVAGATTISGTNTVAGPFGLQQVYYSRLALDGVDGNSLITDDLVLSDSGRLDCIDQAFVSIGDHISTAGLARIGGVGYFNLNGAVTTLANGGWLVPGPGAGLVFRNNNGGLFDLDGTSGGGVLDLSTDGEAYMRFIGSGLLDTFSGSIFMTSGAELDMDLTSGWAADSASEIVVTTTPLTALALIRGGPMSAAGSIQISGQGGWLHLDPASLTIQSTMDADIAANNFLEIDQDTPAVVNGGTFNIGNSGNLSGGVNFHGPTTMHGGQFNMTVPDLSMAQLKFYGDTTWDGTISMTGNAGQYGDATVSGPTVINARRFVMSPNSQPFQTTWSIDSGLVINAHGLGWTASSTWATINIGGGLLPKLTVNLDTPDDHWAALGDINIVGSGSIFVTRIAGSRMHTTGNFTLASGKAQVTSDTHFLAGSVNIGPASAELKMAGLTTVGSAVTFTGQGLLRNGSTGEMTLSIDTELGQVGLANEGRLNLGVTGIGTASVDRFTNAAGATWNVDIGGPNAGTQHDLLLVSGGNATLGGSLDVRLAAPGVPFVPSIGDEFTILTALGNVSGSFTANPVTQSAGSLYHWSVIYNTHTVVLHLDGITPAPCNDADVAGLGGTIGPDGQLTADDIVVFLNAFFAGNTAIADIAGLGGAPGADGAITPDDLVYFLAKFFRPCDE
ncbi:MAG: GC-type dockerin domain-anchored protein [Phycisphaerales bacterium]